MVFFLDPAVDYGVLAAVFDRRFCANVIPHCGCIEFTQLAGARVTDGHSCSYFCGDAKQLDALASHNASKVRTHLRYLCLVFWLG